RHHGGKRLGPAVGNRAQPADGMGSDASGGGPPLGLAVRCFPRRILSCPAARVRRPSLRSLQPRQRRRAMKAVDVMVRDVVTVRPEAEVSEVVRLLAEHDVSALPVVNDAGEVVGIVSEADLIRRAEIGTEKRRPWWLEAVTPATAGVRKVA